jgi:DNA-binding XRE family transcriptional regulator
MRSATESVTHDQVLERALARSSSFRREWERLEFARMIASKVIEYRADYDLTQRALAQKLGLKQPQIARLENAEHEPSYETLARLTSLGMEFEISFKPKRPQRKRAAAGRIDHTIKTAYATIHFAVR